MKKAAASQICIVTVIGEDRVGIIARLATTLAKVNVNIVDVSQRILDHTFVMTMAVDVTRASADMATIKRRLDRVARDLELTITLQDEHIFEVMHRV